MNRIKITTTITQEMSAEPEVWGLDPDATYVDVVAAVRDIYENTGEGIEQIVADDDAIWDTSVERLDD